jgi:putative transposase
MAQHIVFHREEALSNDMARMLEKIAPAARFARADAWLDAGDGSCGLTETDVASDLELAIRARDDRYDVLAWCIMPTHVHVLIVQHSRADLGEIVGPWMRSGRPPGPASAPRDAIVWSPTFLVVTGSGDAWIAATKRHIDDNPVAAGLAGCPRAWRWSSASRGVNPTRPRSAPAPAPAPSTIPSRKATHVIFWLDDALSWRFPHALARRPSGQRAYMLDKALDAGHGRRSLIRREAAATVQREILAADGERYTLIAWCVMPTHVHVLISEVEDWPVAEIVGLWKSATLAAANARRLFRFGASPWARDYAKTAITGDNEIEDVKSYIEHNPVINGLARTPLAWDWSSAKYPRAKAGQS